MAMGWGGSGYRIYLYWYSYHSGLTPRNQIGRLFLTDVTRRPGETCVIHSYPRLTKDPAIHGSHETLASNTIQYEYTVIYDIDLPSSDTLLYELYTAGENDCTFHVPDGGHGCSAEIIELCLGVDR